MRLLDTSSLSLHEFSGNSVPHYAILSHRWAGEEVTFQDLKTGEARRNENRPLNLLGSPDRPQPMDATTLG